MRNKLLLFLLLLAPSILMAQAFPPPAGGGGGTLAIGDTITGATEGSLFYSGLAGILAQNNANLFWNNTNKRLGIGTATPDSLLKIDGTVAATLSSTTFTGSGLDDGILTGYAVVDGPYRVMIDSEGTPDTFSWSWNGTQQATGIPIDGMEQSLDGEVSITFLATTGHTATDYWEATATLGGVFSYNQGNALVTASGTMLDIQNIAKVGLLAIEQPNPIGFLVGGMISGLTASAPQYKGHGALGADYPFYALKVASCPTPTGGGTLNTCGGIIVADQTVGATNNWSARFGLGKFQIGAVSGEVILDGLTASMLVQTDASKGLVSSNDLPAGATLDGDAILVSGGALSAATYSTATNCADSAGDAACGAAPAGSFVIDAGDNSSVVSTTAITANSQVFLQIDASLGDRLSATCNTGTGLALGSPRVTARTAATSFTATIDIVGGPVENPLCMNYWIVN